MIRLQQKVMKGRKEKEGRTAGRMKGGLKKKVKGSINERERNRNKGQNMKDKKKRQCWGKKTGKPEITKQ